MPLILPYRGVYPKIDDSAFIAEDAVIIGDVEIGAEASIWYGCVIRGDVNYIRIGAGTNIQDNTTIHVGRNHGPTIIGEGVTVGHKALLHACRLHDECFIGMGAQLLDYSVVERHAMVAAGSLLTAKKTVQSGEIWAGNPAKFFRLMHPEEIEDIAGSKERYIKLAAEYKQAS